MSDLNNNAALNVLVTQSEQQSLQTAGLGTVSDPIPSSVFSDASLVAFTKQLVAYEQQSYINITDLIQNNSNQLTLDLDNVPENQRRAYKGVEITIQFDGLKYGDELKLFVRSVNPDIEIPFSVVERNEDSLNDTIKILTINFNVKCENEFFEIGCSTGALSNLVVVKASLIDEQQSVFSRLQRIKNAQSYRTNVIPIEYNSDNLVIQISHLCLFDRLGELFEYGVNPNSSSNVLFGQYLKEI